MFTSTLILSLYKFVIVPVLNTILSSFYCKQALKDKEKKDSIHVCQTKDMKTLVKDSLKYLTIKHKPQKIQYFKVIYIYICLH